MVRRTLFLACAILGATLQPAFAQVPFKGDLSLLNVPAADSTGCPAQTVRFNVTGGGHVTHMGAVTNAQVVCLNPADLTFTGEFTLTASNGDTVSAQISGHAVPVSGPVIMVYGQFVITGGTGRFEGATGSGTGTGPINLLTGLGTHHLDGTISSPGANK
jgi:hypothetical protein